MPYVGSQAEFTRIQPSVNTPTLIRLRLSETWRIIPPPYLG
jgi:hypothetical protein